MKMKSLNLKNMIEAWETTDRKLEVYNAFYMMSITGFVSKQTFGDFDHYIERKAIEAMK